MAQYERFVKLFRTRITPLCAIFEADAMHSFTKWPLLKRARLEVYRDRPPIAFVTYPNGQNYRIELKEVTHTQHTNRPRWKGTYSFTDDSVREVAFWTYRSHGNGQHYIQFEHCDAYWGEDDSGENDPDLPLDYLLS